MHAWEGEGRRMHRLGLFGALGLWLWGLHATCDPGTAVYDEHPQRQRVLLRSLPCILYLKKNKTFSNGCLGSRIDEGRSEMRYAL